MFCIVALSDGVPRRGSASRRAHISPEEASLINIRPINLNIGRSGVCISSSYGNQQILLCKARFREKENHGMMFGVVIVQYIQELANERARLTVRIHFLVS